jgi:hypothetical protein
MDLIGFLILIVSHACALYSGYVWGKEQVLVEEQ